MDLHGVDCQPKVLKCDSAMSSIAQILFVAVDQKLRGHKTFGCNWVVHRNDTLAVNNGYMIIYIQLLTIQWLLGCVYGECQWSVNDFPSYTFGNQRAASSHPSKVKVLVVVIGKMDSDTLVTSSSGWVSMEPPQFCSCMCIIQRLCNESHP